MRHHLLFLFAQTAKRASNPATRHSFPLKFPHVTSTTGTSRVEAFRQFATFNEGPPPPPNSSRPPRFGRRPLQKVLINIPARRAEARTAQENGDKKEAGDEDGPELTLPVSFPGTPGGVGGQGGGGLFKMTGSPLIDAALTTFIGLGIGTWRSDERLDSLSDSQDTVFLGGVAYIKWYKWNVLNKVSFTPSRLPLKI